MTLRSQDYKNLVVEIPRDDYDGFINQLHYGQMSKIFRQIFESLNEKMAAEGKRFLYEYMDGDAPMTLDVPRDYRKYSKQEDDNNDGESSE